MTEIECTECRRKEEDTIHAFMLFMEKHRPTLALMLRLLAGASKDGLFSKPIRE